ncbi:MAG: AI-2E family transporter [Limisphaerales bacterium]
MYRGNDYAKVSPTALFGAAVVIAGLYFAREVLIPLSVAVLLSFLLAMPCALLERLHFPRGIAVFTTILLALCLVGAIGWLVGSQFYDLAKKLPQYQQTIETKFHGIASQTQGPIARVNRLIKHTSRQLQSPDNKSGTQPSNSKEPSEATPVPVEVQNPPSGPLTLLTSMAGTAMKPLLSLFMILFVLAFMLSYREDLRDRIVRLAGTERMNLTVDTLNETAEKVSRYLLFQLLVNLCLGTLIGTGLYFIGVPSPMLWGAMATLLRFVPYVGVWIAAATPLVLAFAIDPGSTKFLWTAGLYCGAELTTANIIEPLVYGSQTGVSPVALLLAAIFWTWLWGPIGLLLSTPLTVFVAVAGSHVRKLGFLHVLLSDEPVLTIDARFYQRLIAGDRDEASEIVDEYMKEKPLPALFEEVILPSLRLIEDDRARGRLSHEREFDIFQNLREMIEELCEEHQEPHPATDVPDDTDHEHAFQTPALAELVVIVPAKDAADEIVGLMLACLLRSHGVGVRALSAMGLTADFLDDVAAIQARVVCISAVPPTRLRRSRYLLKKLRSRFPETKVVIGVWGMKRDDTLITEKDPDVSPDTFVVNLGEAVTTLIAMSGVPDKKVEPTPLNPQVESARK